MISVVDPDLRKTIPIEDMFSGRTFKLGRGLIKPSLVFERDFDKMPNAHVAITGTSGSGKTTLVHPMIKFYKNNEKIIHIIDPKKDGMKTPGENLFLFTARNSPYSVPVFEFDHNKENGGPKAEAFEIVRLLKKYFFSSAKEHQTGVLFQLVVDTFRLKGFPDEDDSTWSKGFDLNNPSGKKEWLKILPTIEDLYKNLIYFIEVSKLSDDYDFATSHNKNKSKIERILNKEEEGSGDSDKIKEIQTQMIEEYNSLVERIANPNKGSSSTKDLDLSDPDFYKDPKVIRALEGMKLNLKNVANSGVFGSKIPPVTRGVNRYDISGLSPDIQCFVTEIIANKLDRSLRFRGEYNQLSIAYRQRYGMLYDNVLIIDEAQLVLPKGRDASDSTKGLIRVAAEGRGRGLAMVLLTQSPDNIPPIMLRNIGTKIVLKTEPVDVKNACKLLGVEKASLDRVYDIFGTCLLNVDKNYETIALPWVNFKKKAS